MPSKPHGGMLVEIEPVSRDSAKLKGFGAGQRLKIDNEVSTVVSNIANGILSPLAGFMTEVEQDTVLDQMRLTNDVAWTIPALLLAESRPGVSEGDELLLVGADGTPVAVMQFEEAFELKKKTFAEKVYGTQDTSHPGVAKVFNGPGTAIAGELKRAVRPDFGPYGDVTLTPKETRVLFAEKGWKEIVAFQTRNAPHINHEYVQKSALSLVDGLFINPVLGRKKSGDFKDEVILSAYRALVSNYYPKGGVVLSVLHYEMQYAGPREAIMHAIMRKNFGCTHITIGRDHAGVGSFYGPYAAQEIFKEFPDLGITPLFFKEFYYCKKCEGIANERTCPHGETEKLSFSGTALRKMFAERKRPPKEFMRPEVAEAIGKFEHPFVE
jgi:sulfate adenylyltransferase